VLKISRLALLSLLGAATAAAGQTPSKALALVVIRDIAVLDPTASRWIAHQDIVITDTTIAAVRPTGGAMPAAKTTIHGAGKFAIPGLFDTNARLAQFNRESAGSLVANGITSVRDVGTDPARIAEWRRDIAYGKFMGPRIVAACGTPGVTCAAEPATTGTLRDATIASAEFLGRAHDLGSIEVGKIADLVILNGDALADSRHTKSIDAVIFRGEALTRAHLNLLLNAVRR
jgi:adenine deaminase